MQNLEKTRAKIPKKSKTDNSSGVELAENCPKKACLNLGSFTSFYLKWGHFA